jgi:phage shock protein PspC (stress-responsive transcriptional regulator)
MKTTETINLGGYAFTIETDAYQELESYLDEIKSCCGADDDASEIQEDVEVRMAELLNERNTGVVSYAMVREVMEIIGDPREMSSQQEDVPLEEDREIKRKPLMRDIELKKVAGVCAGLAAFFNTDIAFIRILFVVFFCLGFVTEGFFFLAVLLAYACFWIAMPAAITVEQKCAQKGRPMDIKDFRTVRGVKQNNEFVEEFSTVFKTFGRVFQVFFGAILTLVGVCGLASVCLIPMLSEAAMFNLIDFVGFSELFSDLPKYNVLEFAVNNLYAICISSGLFFVWFVYVGVVELFNLKTPRWKPGIILFLLWVVSLLVVVCYMVAKVLELTWLCV